MGHRQWYDRIGQPDLSIIEFNGLRSVRRAAEPTGGNQRAGVNREDAGFCLRRDGVLLAMILICAAYAQWPAAGGYFRGDDFAHLYEIENHGWLEFLFRPQGAHSLIVSYSLLGICWELFGMHAEAWYAVPLAVHLINTTLLYRLLVGESLGTPIRTSPPRLLAAGVALWWGACPIHQATLGWLSASCQATGAMWLLLLFGRLSALRDRRSAPRRREQLGYCALALCAAASFGTSLAVAAVSGPISFFLLRDVDSDVRGPSVRNLWVLLIAIPLLYFAQLFAFSQIWPDPIGAVVLEAHRGSLQLDQLPGNIAMLSRLVVYAAAATVLGGAVAMSGRGLLYGPWAGTSLDAAGSILLTVAAAVVVSVLIAVWRTPCARGRIAAIVIAIFACYAPIALARAYFYTEMSLNEWLTASVPRYHYLGTLLVGWLLFVVVDALCKDHSHRWTAMAAFATIGVLAVTFQAPARTMVQRMLGAQNARGRVEAFRVEVEQLVRRYRVGEIVPIENAAFPSAGWKPDRYTYPGMAALFMVMYPTDEVEGRRIVFIDETDGARALVRARPNSRIARLLVTQEEVDTWTHHEAR